MRYINTVSVLILHRNRMLLAQRLTDPWNGLYGFPAGKVEPGEAFLDAARRELREETGIIALDFTEFYMYQVPFGADLTYIVQPYVLSIDKATADSVRQTEPDKAGPWGWYYLFGKLPSVTPPTSEHIRIYNKQWYTTVSTPGRPVRPLRSLRSDCNSKDIV